MKEMGSTDNCYANAGAVYGVSGNIRHDVMSGSSVLTHMEVLRLGLNIGVGIDTDTLNSMYDYTLRLHSF
jgi:hypothetical protein